MSTLETLRTEPSEWNHPTWPRYGAPGAAVLGTIAGVTLAQGQASVDPAIGAGLGAGVGVLVAWVVLAALD